MDVVGGKAKSEHRMIVIEWIRRPGEGEIFRFDRNEISLGLSPRNDLVLEGRGLLKKHCTFSEGPVGVYLLTSMSGKDAALVNGERCFRGEVNLGDRIQVGSVHLVFRADGTRPVAERPHTPEVIVPEPVIPAARAARALPRPPMADSMPTKALRVVPASPRPSMPTLMPRDTPVAAPAVASTGSELEGEPGLPYVNSVNGLFFPETEKDGDEVPRRGRRPIELAEIPTTTPYGPLRREVQELFRQRRPLFETARLAFELLRRRYRSADFFLASNQEGGGPAVLATSSDERGFVFSRKALVVMNEHPRPVATREGERITTYFPLLADRSSVRGFLVVRGTLGGLDREFLEEVAFLFSMRIASIASDVLAAGAEAAPSGAGPAVFDADTGALTENIDDLEAITEAVERRVIDRVMRRVKGNQSKGAAILNISRGSLISKVKQFGIPDYRSLRRH